MNAQAVRGARQQHNLGVTLVVLAALVALVAQVLLAFPAPAHAAPTLTSISFTTSFTEGSGRLAWVNRSSEAGSARLDIYNAAGKRVYARTISSVRKATSFSAVWTGRFSGANEVGGASGDYVPAGTYKAVLKVTGATGTTYRTRLVAVRYPATPRLTNMTASTTVSPSGITGARAMKVTYYTSVRYDVFLQMVDRATGKTVAVIKLRDVTPNVRQTVYWDGQVTVAGSTVLPSGEVAVAGDVVPPGRYTARITSRTAAAYRYFTAAPAAVTSVTVTKPTTANLNYEQTMALKGSVSPRGVVNRDLTWKSSDETIATVDANGVVTSKRKEGTATITATSAQTPTISGSTSVVVRSSSSLIMTGFSVPNFCPIGRPQSLSGTVSSNYNLRYVRIKITDYETGVEVDQQVSAGSAMFAGGKTLSIANTLDDMILFGKLTQGKKTVRVYAGDALCDRFLYSQTFWVIGPTAYFDFWQLRKSTWAFPLDIKPSNTSAFGSVRDGGDRAHAAIDFIMPVGAPVYAMASGTVERISVGTYYEGTGAVQIKHGDGSVIWYCEVKAATGLKVGDKVVRSQQIAVVQRNNYGTSMLHLEAYSGKATGALYQGANTATYDNVTKASFLRRRDLISPMGVTLLSIPTTRTVR